METYLTHTERKSVVTKRYIRTLKIKTCKLRLLYQKTSTVINF